VDNAYVAVAGIGLLVIGVVGFVAVSVFFLAAALRHEALRRIPPFLSRATSGTRNWIAPPERPRAALASVSVRHTRPGN